MLSATPPRRGKENGSLCFHFNPSRLCWVVRSRGRLLPANQIIDWEDAHNSCSSGYPAVVAQ